MPRILTLDAALATCSAGLVEDGHVLDWRRDGGGKAAALPGLARAILGTGPIDLVAVTVGPGSFTGLRAAIALAHGIAIGAGVEVVGVTIGAAMAASAPAGRTLWTVIDNKRGKVFLERGGRVETVSLDALPPAEGAVAVAGDAAVAVVARLAARGVNVMLLGARAPTPAGIAWAAGPLASFPTRPPLPLYVDPPQATPGPAGRPPPA